MPEAKASVGWFFLFVGFGFRVWFPLLFCWMRFPLRVPFVSPSRAFLVGCAFLPLSPSFFLFASLSSLSFLSSLSALSAFCSFLFSLCLPSPSLFSVLLPPFSLSFFCFPFPRCVFPLLFVGPGFVSALRFLVLFAFAFSFVLLLSFRFVFAFLLSSRLFPLLCPCLSFRFLFFLFRLRFFACLVVSCTSFFLVSISKKFFVLFVCEFFLRWVIWTSSSPFGLLRVFALLFLLWRTRCVFPVCSPRFFFFFSSGLWFVVDGCLSWAAVRQVLLSWCLELLLRFLETFMVVRAVEGVIFSRTFEVYTLRARFLGGSTVAFELICKVFFPKPGANSQTKNTLIKEKTLLTNYYMHNRTQTLGKFRFLQTTQACGHNVLHADTAYRRCSNCPATREHRRYLQLTYPVEQCIPWAEGTKRNEATFLCISATDNS